MSQDRLTDLAGFLLRIALGLMFVAQVLLGDGAYALARSGPAPSVLHAGKAAAR